MKINTCQWLMIIIMLALLLLVFLVYQFSNGKASTSKNNAATGKLLRFQYTYGVFLSGAYEFILESDPDHDTQVIFKAEKFTNEYEPVQVMLNNQVLQDIDSIIKSRDIFTWDGFKQYNHDVKDGYSFNLNVDYEHTKIRASGYMKYPKNYHSGHDELADYLKKLMMDYAIKKDTD